MSVKFEIVTDDGKVHGPYKTPHELREAVASLGENVADNESPHRGVRVVGCEDAEAPQQGN